MSIDKRLVPRVGLLILDLDGVGESNRTVRLRQVINRLVPVELSIELLLNGRDDGIDFDGGSRRGDVSYFRLY